MGKKGVLLVDVSVMWGQSSWKAGLPPKKGRVLREGGSFKLVAKEGRVEDVSGGASNPSRGEGGKVCGEPIVGKLSNRMEK